MDLLMTDTKSLTRKTKSLRMTEDEQAGKQCSNNNNDCFYEHLSAVSKHSFQVCPGKRKSNKPQVVLHSDIFSNQTSILCGFDNDQLLAFDLSQASGDIVELPPKSGAILHSGLSSVKCSNVTPQVFFTGSSEDGKIHLWDGRVKSTKPSQTFTPTIKSNTKTKPILTIDISCGDQFLCAGTELVGEDSFLLFWDLRSTELLGAYWESHSDDITAVKFHPTTSSSLASGSTDGLLNVYNLLEAKEDDALVYSFNTETSVEKLTWNCSVAKSNSDQVACITHLNDLRLWDVTTGDSLLDCNRTSVAAAWQRSNPESVYLNDSYSILNGRLVLFSSSLSGDPCGTFEVINGQLSPRGLFLEETSVIQTTEYLSRDNRWITFNEQGNLKIWSVDNLSQTVESQIHSKITGKRARFKPY